MAVVHSVDFSTPLSGGYKMIAGEGNVGAYATGGAPLNLANYFDSTANIQLIPSTASGYSFEHVGTAASGNIKAYFTSLNGKNGIDQNQAQIEVTAATALNAVKFKFVAIGKAY